MTAHAHESEVFRRVYTDRKGERRRVRTHSIRFRDHLGAVRRLHGFETEREAQKTLHRLEAVVDRLRERMPVTRGDAAWLRSLAAGHQASLTEWGVIEASAINRAKPLDECLADWQASLEAKDRSPRDIRQRVKRVADMLAALGWHDAGDINADDLLRHLHRMREDARPNPRGQRTIAGDAKELVSVRECAQRLGKSWHTVNGWVRAGAPCQERDGKTVVNPVRISQWASDRQQARPISATTSNHYLAAMKAFTLWMEDAGRIDRSPLRRVKGVNADAWKSRRVREGGKNTERRALEADEVRRILEAARRGPDNRMGTPPEHQHAVILLAVTTGLRLSELESLRAGDFDFEEGVVRVEAGYSKNRQRVDVLLRPDVAATLRPLLARKAPATPAFIMPGRHRLARMVRDIARDAGVDEYDDAGRRLDFHCLRHTFVTALVKSGVDIKVAQTLARHSTPSLTLGVYSHAQRPHLADNLGRLPDYLSPSEDARQRQAAGAETTLGNARCADVARNASQHRAETPNTETPRMDAGAQAPRTPTIGITDGEGECDDQQPPLDSPTSHRRGGRVVECAGLENRDGAPNHSGATGDIDESSDDDPDPVRVGAAPMLRADPGEGADDPHISELVWIWARLGRDARRRLLRHAMDLDELQNGGGS